MKWRNTGLEKKNNMGLNKIENQNKALAIYLMENKELRPLQNVRNFFGFKYLLKASSLDFESNQYEDIEDTFYE